MATMKVCDRCHGPINPASSRTTVSFGEVSYTPNNPTYELCCSCAYHLKQFLNNPPDRNERIWDQ